MCEAIDATEKTACDHIEGDWCERDRTRDSLCSPVRLHDKLRRVVGRIVICTYAVLWIEASHKSARKFNGSTGVGRDDSVVALACSSDDGNAHSHQRTGRQAR